MRVLKNSFSRQNIQRVGGGGNQVREGWQLVHTTHTIPHSTLLYPHKRVTSRWLILHCETPANDSLAYHRHRRPAASLSSRSQPITDQLVQKLRSQPITDQLVHRPTRHHSGRWRHKYLSCSCLYYCNCYVRDTTSYQTTIPYISLTFYNSFLWTCVSRRNHCDSNYRIF